MNDETNELLAQLSTSVVLLLERERNRINGYDAAVTDQLSDLKRAVDDFVYFCENTEVDYQ